MSKIWSVKANQVSKWVICACAEAKDGSGF